MKLLFDQNLSPRLPQLLSQIFPDSIHVRDVGLQGAEDDAIWNYAKANGFVLVSKDSDFQQRSLLYGFPPKFIWLRVGNCPVERIERLLKEHADTIEQFNADQSLSHLILR